MELKFTKMNGAGNDFVLLDNRAQTLSLDAGRIARLCDRHRGVGADGVLVVEPARNDADFRMRYYNADGGEAEMCGNGARCFARFAQRLAGSTGSISFETQAGVIRAECEGPLVRVVMGDPHSHRTAQALEVNGRMLDVHFLNTGVPHAVVLTDDLDSIDVARDGAAIRHHPAFAPRGTNANFVQILEPSLLAVRTFERGVEAETLACGTGVCAAAVVHHLASGAPPPISVKVRGGEILEVSFAGGGGAVRDVRLKGPAEFVFEGAISL